MIFDFVKYYYLSSSGILSHVLSFSNILFTNSALYFLPHKLHVNRLPWKALLFVYIIFYFDNESSRHWGLYWEVLMLIVLKINELQKASFLLTWFCFPLLFMYFLMLFIYFILCLLGVFIVGYYIVAQFLY